MARAPKSLAGTVSIAGTAAFAGLAVLAAANEVFNASPALVRNLLLLAGFTAAAVKGLTGRPVDLPFPRARAWTWLFAGGAAVLAGLPSLTLPYLADDYCFLNDWGRAPSFGAALFDVQPGAMWFRPVYWALWRFYEWASPERGGLAHAVSVGLLAVNAGCAVPALRRAGVPRGTAVAAAFLFALSPAALETTAWATNQCSNLASIFSLACLASLPVRRSSWIRHLLPALFAGLAFLSKEETFLLPVLAVAVAARFRWRSAFAAAVRLWPLFAVLTCVVVGRALLLKGIGGFRDEQGQSRLLTGLLTGPVNALSSEFPSRYFLLLRVSLYSPAVWASAGLMGFVLLTWGGASALARRCVPRAAAIFAIAIAPMVPLLPIGDMIDEARWLYAPTVGISLAAAALLAGGPLRGVKGWIPVLAFGALSWAAGATNFRAWRQAGNVLESARSAIAPRLKALPPGSTALVLNLPSQVNGAYCFISGKLLVLARWAEPTAVNTPSPETTVGPLAAMLVYDVNGKQAIDYLDAGERAHLPAGGTVAWSAAHSPNAFRGLLANSLDIEPRGGAWRFSSDHPDAILALPCLDLEGSGNLRVGVQGGFLARQDNVVPAEVFVTYEAGGKLTRAQIPVDTPFPLPPSATRARIDIPVPIMRTLELSRVTMTLEPRK